MSLLDDGIDHGCFSLARNRLLLWRGTRMDATVIEALSSTKNATASVTPSIPWCNCSVSLLMLSYVRRVQLDRHGSTTHNGIDDGKPRGQKLVS